MSHSKEFEGLMTRKQVASALGITVEAVRRREGVSLHPTVRDGVHYFHKNEVDVVANTYNPHAPRNRKVRDYTPIDSGTTADIFDQFDKGVEPKDVVKVLRVSPEIVMTTYNEWLTLSQASLKPKEKPLGACTGCGVKAELHICAGCVSTATIEKKTRADGTILVRFVAETEDGTSSLCDWTPVAAIPPVEDK